MEGKGGLDSFNRDRSSSISGILVRTLSCQGLVKIRCDRSDKSAAVSAGGLEILIGSSADVSLYITLYYFAGFDLRKHSAFCW